MKQTPHIHVLVLSLLCLRTSLAQNSTLRCSRDPPQDQSESPQFLCDVDVTVARNPDCSATITERYLYPYTTGRNAFRSISLIEGQQVARNVVALRDNTTLFNRSRLESHSGRNEVRVNLPTKQRDQPVLFTLQYILDSAVTQFTTECPETDSAPPDNETVNVIRWRTGVWEQTFDKMRVSFSTNNENASLSVASAANGQVLASSSESSIIISWEDLSTEDRSIDVLVVERGTELCTEKLQCVRTNGSSKDLTGFIIVFCAVAVVCCAGWQVCGCGEGRGNFSGGIVGGGGGGGGGGLILDIKIYQ